METKTITANVPVSFAIEVKKLHLKYDVELISYRGINGGLIEVEVRGDMENLIALNAEVHLIAYGFEAKKI